MMIKRALFLALWCVCGALASLTVGDDDECALHISGPARSSAYDYSINLLKGNFGYEGQPNCITYDAVNQAYLEARNRILVSQPKGDWKAEDFASVGELMLDISINLARRYGLTYEEIEKGLPLIDTSRTLIREVCPPVFSHVECRAGKYRRLDGLCNNLQHPTWGATMAPFQRLIGPLFADGINAPRISHTGHDLPLSRVVSRTMHPDDGFHDHAGTVMVIAWGQFMDHDFTLTGTPLDPINRNDPEECCKRPPHLKHPYCNEIRIPDDDYFYRLFGVKCIDFVRGFPSPRPGCRLGSRVPFNTLTGAIDGNTVYGVTEKFSRKLRTGFGGLLRMNPVFKEYGLKDLLPLKLDIPDEGCTRPNKNMYCFEAGEIRVNEQLVLTVMHTLMAREHNRVAKGLAEVNPHWDDETLFQEARRINIAEIQHITYNEFLPILLGKDVMEKFGLVLEKEGYWDGYDTEVNPDVLASFAAAAYRFGHSLLPTAVERWSKAHKFIASKRLSDLIRRPYDLYRAGVLDEYVMGLMNQVAQAMDDSITQEVTNHLFKKVGARFGMDLVSFNMQRGREFGLPGYMEFRKFCGLPGADSFQDLFGSMTNHTVRKYESIFEHPIDVDLWSGGVSERPLPGSMLGPTFACVIATQFSYARRGDRFWFELPNQPSSFTPEQIQELRKARLARVICDNTDIIDTVQLYPMVLPDHELNPRVPCRSGILPSMDFSKWAEPTPFRGSAKQFITDAFIIERNQTNDTETGSQTETTEQDNTTEEKENMDCPDCRVTVPAQNISECSIIIGNNTFSSLKDCNTTPHDNTPHVEHDIKTNEIPDSDTVLKYVYKKNDKREPQSKTKGHDKNSVKRRKRSSDDEIPIFSNNQNNDVVARSVEINDDVESSPSSIKHAPLIVDYETTHKPRGKITWLTSLENPNIIRSSDLADFNLETLHKSLRSNDNLDLNIGNSGKHTATEADHLNDHKNERNDNTKYEENDGRDSHRDRGDYRLNIENSHGDGYKEKEHREQSVDRGNSRGDNYREKEDNDYPVNKENSYINNNRDKEPKTYPVNRENDHGEDYNGKEDKHYPVNRENRHGDDYSGKEDKHYPVNRDNRHGNDYNGKEYIHYPVNRENRHGDDHNGKEDKHFSVNREKSHGDDYSGKEDIHNPVNKDNSRGDNYRANDNKDYPVNREDNRNSNFREKEEKEYVAREDISDNNNKEKDDKEYPVRQKSHDNSFREKEDLVNREQSREDSYSRREGKDYPSSRDNYRENTKPDFGHHNKYSPSSENRERGENHESNENKNSYSNNGESEERPVLRPSNYYPDDNLRSRDDRHNGKDRYRQDTKAYKPQPAKSSESNVGNFRGSESLNERSNENSEEISPQIKFHDINVPPKNANLSSPIPIQEVDLGDFSYERIHLNDNGAFIPSKENLESADPNSAVELISPAIVKTELVPQKSDTTTNDVVKINHGEIKPVVEISSESDTSELSDENSKESLQTNLNNENESKSLESLLGVKESDTYEQNDKIIATKPQSVDIKQDFERIPLNYKYIEDKNQKQSKTPIIHEAPKEESTGLQNNDGTIDVFTPNDVRYDENLKIKFDDVTVKLPEIKLPDDILAYARENSPYKDEINDDEDDEPLKSPFYNYNNDDTEEKDEQRPKNSNDHYNSPYTHKEGDSKEKNNDHEGAEDQGYYNPYYQDQEKSQDQKEEQEEELEEDEDLYEKFVRERFGKQGTFEKRSEQLRDGRETPLNPKLYQTIQNILNKTAEIEKQAVKSGDPNAGYMWTLEYGENL